MSVWVAWIYLSTYFHCFKIKPFRKPSKNQGNGLFTSNNAKRQNDVIFLTLPPSKITSSVVVNGYLSVKDVDMSFQRPNHPLKSSLKEFIFFRHRAHQLFLKKNLFSILLNLMYLTLYMVIFWLTFICIAFW